MVNIRSGKTSFFGFASLYVTNNYKCGTQVWLEKVRTENTVDTHNHKVKALARNGHKHRAKRIYWCHSPNTRYIVSFFSTMNAYYLVPEAEYRTLNTSDLDSTASNIVIDTQLDEYERPLENVIFLQV